MTDVTSDSKSLDEELRRLEEEIGTLEACRTRLERETRVAEELARIDELVARKRQATSLRPPPTIPPPPAIPPSVPTIPPSEPALPPPRRAESTAVVIVALVSMLLSIGVFVISAGSRATVPTAEAAVSTPACVGSDKVDPAATAPTNKKSEAGVVPPPAVKTAPETPGRRAARAWSARPSDTAASSRAPAANPTNNLAMDESARTAQLLREQLGKSPR
jgi:hypothetical protein